MAQGSPVLGSWAMGHSSFTLLPGHAGVGQEKEDRRDFRTLVEPWKPHPVSS